MHHLQGLIGYDAIKNSFVTFGPAFGFKAIWFEETLVAFNTNGTTGRDKTLIQSAIPLIGFETKFNINKNLTLGITPYGFGWEKLAYFGGQSYLAIDFNREWGMRLGFDADYLSRSLERSSKFSADAGMLAAYIQAVYGW